MKGNAKAHPSPVVLSDGTTSRQNGWANYILMSASNIDMENRPSVSPPSAFYFFASTGTVLGFGDLHSRTVVSASISWY
jgi:hypothetical protein